MIICTLPIDASADAIKALHVEWSELLAENRYSDALTMFPVSGEELEWTPEAL